MSGVRVLGCSRERAYIVGVEGEVCFYRRVGVVVLPVSEGVSLFAGVGEKDGGEEYCLYRNLL